MVSRSFGKPVTQRHELEHAVSTYTERAATKMRGQQLAAREVHVFAISNRFKPTETQDGLAAIWRENIRYKKAGVILLGLTPAASVQGDLWENPDTPTRKRLMRTIDQINADHGRDTVTLAASGRKQPWNDGRRDTPAIGMSCCAWGKTASGAVGTAWLFCTFTVQLKRSWETHNGPERSQPRSAPR
jgi:hypothetical protein